MPKILLVDDDPQALDSTRRILELAGHEVVVATDGQAALEIARPPGIGGARRFDVVVTDVRMPRMGGLDFLRAISLCSADTPVILMTAFGRVEDAVWAMKLGAIDFLTKPFKRQTLLSAVDGAMKRSKPALAIGSESHTAAPDPGPLLLGSSGIMRALLAQISQVAPTSATVLIQGESGSGKERVARLIHDISSRKEARFVALNCAAIPEQLIESELFGVEKGAFTGAGAAREGLFESADGGTLLLDEIGDMPLTLQAKLLRVLQDGEVRRVGATSSRRVDVRVLAATHRDLKQAATVGAFRPDLLFRLEVISLAVPALRQRREDVRELSYHFLQTSSRRHSREINAIADETLKRLEAHPWPGNVRELANVIERAVVFARTDTIGIQDLPEHFLRAGESPIGLPPAFIEVPIGTPLKDVEDLLIRKTLEATDGDKNMTARLLGINSRTIYRKLDRPERKD